MKRPLRCCTRSTTLFQLARLPSLQLLALVRDSMQQTRSAICVAPLWTRPFWPIHRFGGSLHDSALLGPRGSRCGRAPCMRVLTRIRESYFHRQLPTHLICTILGPEAAAAYYTIFLSLSSGERLHSAHSSCKMASPQRLPFHSDCLSTATAFPQ